MSDAALRKAAGAAALAGGILRIVNIVLDGRLPAGTMHIIYFVEDLLLLIGLLGIWLAQRQMLGVLGLVGALLGIVGLFTIRSQALFGPWGYQLGAGELLLGLLCIGVRMLSYGRRAAPILWILALVLGLGSLAPSLAGPLAAAAALCFGAGFAIAGADLLRQRAAG
jgi:hypothetical protein